MKYTINTEETGGSVAYKGERSKLKGPYHFCGRCGSRVNISEMEWQRGVLVCKKWDCQDKHPFIGEREAAIASALENISTGDELRPDPKLTEPVSGGTNADDDIVF